MMINNITENVKLYALENTKEKIYCWQMNNNKTCELPFYSQLQSIDDLFLFAFFVTF